MVKHIDQVSEEEIVKLNIPTGIPLVYDFDNEMQPIKHYYLGDQEEIRTSINKVQQHGQALFT